MMRWFRKHKNAIILVMLGGFVAGSFMGFGSYFFTQSPHDAAIIVNGTDISYKKFQNRFHQYLRQREDDKSPLTEDKMKALKQQAAQDLIRETVFLQESEKFGTKVTDNEVSAYIQSIPAFQKDGKFEPSAYNGVLAHVLRVPPDEFEEERRQDIKIQKMQILMASSVKITDLELNDRFQKRMMAATPEEREKFAKDPNALREEIRQEQMSHVMQSWLASVNKGLKVKFRLDRWEGKPDA